MQGFKWQNERCGIIAILLFSYIYSHLFILANKWNHFNIYCVIWTKVEWMYYRVGGVLSVQQSYNHPRSMSVPVRDISALHCSNWVCMLCSIVNIVLCCKRLTCTLFYKLGRNVLKQPGTKIIRLQFILDINI